jgi:hypothetical protein
MHSRGGLTRMKARGHKESTTIDNLETWSDTMDMTVQGNSEVMGGKKKQGGR